MNRAIKRLQFIVLVLVATAGLAINACSDKETTITPEVKFAKTEFTFPNSGGTGTLAIQTNIPLEVVSADESWCTVTKIDIASTKVVQYTITTTANPEPETRQTKITVSGSGFEAEVSVIQTAGDLIEITNDAMSFECQ
ncbi:MAG: BACON domain-containing protein [Breznakibacter sp.]